MHVLIIEDNDALAVGRERDGAHRALALLLENVRGQRNAEDLAAAARISTSILLEEDSEQPHGVLFAYSSCLSVELTTLRSGY